MKKLRIFGMVTLIVSIIGFILWRFVLPLPDWFMRAVGILMLVSIVTTVFSAVRISLAEK